MKMKIENKVKRQIYTLKKLNNIDLEDLNLIRRVALNLKMYELIAFINQNWKEYLDFIQTIK